MQSVTKVLLWALGQTDQTGFRTKWEARDPTPTHVKLSTFQTCAGYCLSQLKRPMTSGKRPLMMRRVLGRLAM